MDTKGTNMFTGNLANYRVIRKGFTLVELLVSMAIIIFMLSIMSQAFVIATTCMSGLKGVGELLDKGRPVLAVLQKDLSAYHFDGYKRLSDADFWDNGPPRQGYFQIYEGYSEGILLDGTILPKPMKIPKETDVIKENEGRTNDGVVYQRSGTISDHRLAFTSRLSGKNPDDFYVTAFEQYNPIAEYTSLINVFNSNITLQTSKNSQRYDFNSGVLHSQWAEIAYFTKANNRTANGTPLMDLYRQQKVILPSNSEANALSLNAINIVKYENFSCRQIPNNPGPPASKIYFNSPTDLTMPGYRMTSSVPNTLYPYSDLLVTDVISFDVRVLTDNSLQDFSLVSSLLSSLAFRYNQIQNQPTFPVVFDTWTTGNDGTQYDIGNFDTGVWQPTAWDASKSPLVPPLNSLIPIWNHNRAGNIRTPIKGLRINAIQVSIRLWDEKSQKAREFKIIQRI